MYESVVKNKTIYIERPERKYPEKFLDIDIMRINESGVLILERSNVPIQVYAPGTWLEVTLY